MAQEYKGSLRVNFFPSQESYDTNKNALTDTDVSFIPFVGGMSLSEGESGWVRDESTGLTIQWSYGASSRTWTFPRPFTEVYYAASSSESTGKSSSGLDYVNKVTKTNMSSLGYGSNSYLLAIGIS